MADSWTLILVASLNYRIQIDKFLLAYLNLKQALGCTIHRSSKTKLHMVNFHGDN